MKIIDEIKSVGLRDWLWFVVYLRRNEFNHKLDVNYEFVYGMKGSYYKKKRRTVAYLRRITVARYRAHSIEEALARVGISKR